MTLPPEQDEYWRIVLRLRNTDAEPIVKELADAGFRVTYAG